MDEQKTLTLDFIKSLMEPAYTLIWTDYNDNLDNHCGLIQKCLDSKSREHLWEKADECTAMPNGKLSVRLLRN